MPVQAFVDDSGGKGHDRHFVLAGLIADADAWLTFSEEWRECLIAAPAIRCFKMREAARLTGQFYRWSEPARDEKLRAFARVINRHVSLSTYSVIDLDAHAEAWAKTNAKPRNEPYFWPFHNTILAACFTLWDLGCRERFEIVFDENVIFGPRAKLWYPMVLELMRLKEPAAATIMPVDPVFRTDDEFMPIQAADMFAWCIRNATTRPDDRQFEWLLGEMGNLRGSEYSQYYDKARMEAVTADSLRQLRDGSVPVELTEMYRKILGG